MLAQDLNWVMMGDAAMRVSFILQHIKLLMRREREKVRLLCNLTVTYEHINSSLPAGEYSPGSVHRKTV